MEIDSNNKIGILTYFDDINDGTLLQAYTISAYFQKCFGKNKVEIINYKAMKKKSFYFVNYTNIKFFDYVKKVLKTKKFIDEELPLSTRSLLSCNYEQSLEFIRNRYDMIVTGSDTIWQILPGDKKVPAFPNIYWLDASIQCKKVAFAASANRTNKGELSEKIINIVNKSLNSYDLIGVRDDLTLDFVSDIIDKDHLKKVYKVPDPTFTFDIPESGVDELMLRKGIKLNEPIIGVALPPNELTNKLIKYYQKREYQILLLSRFDRFSNMHNIHTLALNPLEWADIYKYLTLCITDRFHGSLFCLKNKIPFVTIDFQEYYLKTDSKTKMLLRDFKMADNILNIHKETDALKTIVEKADNVLRTFNRDEVGLLLNEMRKRCNDFMQKVKALS